MTLHDSEVAFIDTVAAMAMPTGRLTAEALGHLRALRVRADGDDLVRIGSLLNGHEEAVERVRDPEGHHLRKLRQAADEARYEAGAELARRRRDAAGEPVCISQMFGGRRGAAK